MNEDKIPIPIMGKKTKNSRSPAAILEKNEFKKKLNP